MKPIEQIDQRINEKLDALLILETQSTDTFTDKMVNNAEQRSVIAHIHSLIWVMDASDFALLPDDTKRRIEALCERC